MSPLVSENHLAENPSVSTDDMTLLREAAAFHKSGDKEKARELLQQAAEINPANELVLLWQASLARTAAEAMSAIEKVLDLNPDNEKAIGWKVKLEARFPTTAPARPAATEVVEEAEPEASVEPVEEASTDTDVVEELGEEASAESEAAEAEFAEEGTAEVVEIIEDEEPETSSEVDSWTSEESAEETVEESLTEETTEEVELVVAEDESTEDDELAALEAEVAAVEEADEQFYGTTVEAEASTEELIESASEETDSAEDFWSQTEETEESEEFAEVVAEEEPYDSTARALEALDHHVSEPTTLADDDDPIRRMLAEKDGDSEELYAADAESTDSWDSAEVDTEAFEADSDDEDSDGSSLLAMLTQDDTVSDTNESGDEEEAAVESDDERDALIVEPTVNTHWECPLCSQQSHRVEPWCPSCKAIVDLTRVPEMAQNDDVDRVSLKRLIADWEDQVEIEPDPVLFTKIALAYLNLRQSNSALPHLLSAARMDRGNDALATAIEEVSRRPLILVVDDSRTVQRMVLSTLEKELFRVQIAEDGLQALAKLNDETPSLILLDITMPRMDGYQVCKVITGNEAFKHIPVVMLSGKDGFFDKMKGRMVGAKDYITKPFEGDSLVKTVRKRIDVPAR